MWNAWIKLFLTNESRYPDSNGNIEQPEWVLHVRNEAWESLWVNYATSKSYIYIQENFTNLQIHRSVLGIYICIYTLSTTSMDKAKPAPPYSFIKPLRTNIVSGLIDPSPMQPNVPNNKSSLSTPSANRRSPRLLSISDTGRYTLWWSRSLRLLSYQLCIIPSNIHIYQPNALGQR